MAAIKTETKTIGHTTGNNKSKFDFSTSDFAKLVKTTPFVDKTLMIRDIFHNSSLILLTAPRKFGKTTNIDMVKRFLEIEVDAQGIRKPIQTTKNYKLFKDNKLDICTDESFFSEHFGKYPVIYIDCDPLGEVHTFVHMLDMLKSIITKSFNQHLYLLKSIKFKIDSAYFDDQQIENTSEADLIHSYEYLPKILYRHFEKEVFVLIDNCDAFINSTLFKNNNKDTQKMISLIKKTIGNLLKKNQYVERTLLTGVLPVTGVGFPFHENNIDWYSFLDNNCFTKYFGLTLDELNKLLTKVTKDSEERNLMESTINEYYNGYSAGDHSIPVYNIWSVLKYLHRKVVQSYWWSNEFTETFMPFFKNTEIRKRLEQLLLGNKLQVMYTSPISVKDVLKHFKIIEHGTVESMSPLVESILFFLLYNFGYLSKDKFSGLEYNSLKIPSKEIKYELSKFLLQTFYGCNQEVVNNFRFIVDSFQPDMIHVNEACINFKNKINDWLQCLISKSSVCNFFNCLFMVLLITGHCSKIIAHKLGPSGPVVILFKNIHQIVVCITVKIMTNSYCSYDACTMEEIARNTVKTEITDNHYEEHVFDKYTNMSGKIFIAINYNVYNIRYSSNYYCQVAIAYSYDFKEGDSLQNFIIVL